MPTHAADALLSRCADMAPPLGFPGGPEYVIERVLQETSNQEMANKVESGQGLEPYEQRRVYRPESESGPGGPIQTLLITPHAEYRMDLRGVVVPELRLVLRNFLKQLRDWKSQGAYEYDAVARVFERAEPYRWGDPQIGLVIVFAPERPVDMREKPLDMGKVVVITTFWQGIGDTDRVGARHLADVLLRTAFDVGETLSQATVDALLHGSLGIPRSEMPQIRAVLVPDFLAELEADGIRSAYGSRAVGSLKPTQGEIHANNVVNMFGVLDQMRSKPLIVSSDGYILDGHHRWAALTLADPTAPIDTVEIDLPMRELLERARHFGAVSFKAQLDLADVPLLTGAQIEALYHLWAARQGYGPSEWWGLAGSKITGARLTGLGLAETRESSYKDWAEEQAGPGPYDEVLDPAIRYRLTDYGGDVAAALDADGWAGREPWDPSFEVRMPRMSPTRGAAHVADTLLWRSDKIPGGRGDGRSPEEFDADQVSRGREIEREHSPDPEIRTEIALDHLSEIPDYYTRLDQMEEDAMAHLMMDSNHYRESSAHPADALLSRRAEPRGKVQTAIMAFVEQWPSGHEEDLADMARNLRGVHFERLQSAVQALANQGLIGYDGSSRVRKLGQTVGGIPLDNVVSEIEKMVKSGTEPVDIIVAIYERFPQEASSALMEAQSRGVFDASGESVEQR